jgi:hypothetical protein
MVDEVSVVNTSQTDETNSATDGIFPNILFYSATTVHTSIFSKAMSKASNINFVLY